MLPHARASSLADVIDSFATHPDETRTTHIEPSPLLDALRAAGTGVIYADTADVESLGALLTTRAGGQLALDGNTANQPLVAKVAERYLDANDARTWAQAVAAAEPATRDTLPVLYAILCAVTANDMRRALGGGRRWESSLQLHMDLCGRPADALRIGSLIHAMAPGALVKVPFTPDEPSCLLVARELVRWGVPVNVTSTFSARQVVIAALLTRAERTNVFLGRLSQGLQTERLGEHVLAAAQRALHELRRDEALPTRLLAASMRDWRTFHLVAGADGYTAPVDVIRDFLAQDEIGPHDIAPCIEERAAERPALPEPVRRATGTRALDSLDRVEPELVRFVQQLARSPEYTRLRVHAGDAVRQRFEDAGFGDVFHEPSDADRAEAARAKLPQLDGQLIGRVALDTHYSLLANADFAGKQAEIDALLARRLEGRAARPGS